MRSDPWRDSCPDFPDLMSRLSRLKLLARICNLGLNPGAARPLARLMSRLSRPYVQTFPTRTLGANLQFGSKSGCGATLGGFLSRLSRPYDKTFNTQTLGANVQFGSKSGCSATLARLISTLSRPYVQTFQKQTVGENLQFGTKPGCGATLGATHVQTFQTLCPDFPDSNCWRESAIWD